MNKPIRLLFCLLVILQLFPASPIFAETVQDVPVGETTISSKAEDPLKEYKEKAQNQVPTVDSVISQDVPEVEKEAETSPTKIKEDAGESPTPEDGDAEEQADRPTRPTPRGGGGISPQTITLIEGDPDVDDPSTYHIDKDFAELIRTDKSTTNSGWYWSGYGKAANTLTSDDMENLTLLEVMGRSLKSLKGIEFAVNLFSVICAENQLSTLDISNNISLTEFNCYNNQLSTLDVSSNTALTSLVCFNNQLSTLDVSNNTALTTLSCGDNQLSVLDVSNNTLLTDLYCGSNQLTALDVSNNTLLTSLNCYNNQLTALDVNNNTVLTSLFCNNNQIGTLNVSNNTALTEFNCGDNPLGVIDVSNNIALTRFFCENNQLSSLNVSSNTLLTDFGCGDNPLGTLDVSHNTALTQFSCYANQLNTLDVSANTALTRMYCYDNSLSTLDVSNNSALTDLYCSDNQLTTLDVSNNTALTDLNCSDNQLTTLDVSNNSALIVLRCSNNSLNNITSLNGLANLTFFEAMNQSLSVPVPLVTPGGEAVVDVLKTTAQTGLTVTNVDIVPPPSSISPNASNGDIIELTGVTKHSLSDKSIQFEYDSDALAEGASSYTRKTFSGTITFAVVSELKNELQVSSDKTKKGDELTWKWTITSLTQKTAEDIKAIFTLPNYQAGDISDIQITHQPSGTTQTGTINHLNGTTSLGDLDQDESIEITFKSVARGDPDSWYEAVGRLDWSDTTPSSPHYNESKQQFKILDEEQQDLPKESDDMGILSAPVRFHFGRQTLLSSISTHQLNAQNYQTNTNVVTDGFYTRIKDDRVTSTGWKLTASLSEFTDSVGRQMPNGVGTSLRLENMFIQKVNDRDTPQEALDPAATGAPSTVQTDETLVAGQTAKTLVSAQVNEGQGTWQLQMPFDDISLTLPAGAGRSNTDYTAKLTWSLDNTP